MHTADQHSQAEKQAKQALLFDMDGTMFDNMAFHGQSWLRFFAQRNIALDEAQFFSSTAGRQNHEIFRSYLQADLDDAQCAQMAEEKEQLYRTLYADQRVPMPGLLALLAQARKLGIGLAVGTAAPPENIYFLLDELGDLALRQQFDHVVGAADVKRGKPEPDIFLLAAERCGASPADCIVFEDAPLGVEAARRAGMRCIALTTTNPASSFAKFDNLLGCISDFSDLSNNLPSLFAARAPSNFATSINHLA